MAFNLTRFYYDDSDSSVQSPLIKGKVVEDFERSEADAHEAFLQAQGIEYTRIDL